MRVGRLKERLNAGEVMLGTFVRSAEPATCEVLALCGFDFLVLDGEHSPLGIRELAGLVRAADGAGVPALVRVRENAPFPIMQALDMGASGVQVPQVNSAEEARQLVQSAKYYPLGQRGFAATHRAANHGFNNPIEYTRTANQDTLVVCYIETRQAVESVQAIAAVDGIDVLFCGPYDLSQSYGVPGETTHSDVQKALDQVVAACNQSGKVAGTIAGSIEQAECLVKRGFRFLSYSSDLGMLALAAKSAVVGLKGHID